MKGCDRDTDGDGNCPVHPAGCPPAKSLTEERLAMIQSRFVHFVYKAEANDDVAALLAEVRRLRAAEHPHGCIEAGEMLKQQLDQDKALLLERARQADQLIAQRDEALAIHNELYSAASGFLTSTELQSERGMDVGARWLRDVLDMKPFDANQLQRARRAVVEAAKEWRAADRAEVQDLTLEALEKIEAAVDALEKLEARP